MQLNEKLFRDDEDRQLCLQLTDFVEEEDIGTWDGESSGAGSMDISFIVKDKVAASEIINAYLKEHFPGLIYYISDHYEPLFDYTC